MRSAETSLAGDGLVALSALAAAAIRHALERGPAPEHGEFARAGASFVTLRRHERLRGCIGTLEAWRPLGEDVCHNARAAALEDPRFAPLTPAELAGTMVEVSVLAAPQPLTVASRAELLNRLRVGVDGLTIAHGARRATFLPAVWAQLPEPASFVEHLLRKAGIDAAVAFEELSLETYTATHTPALALT
ncbi:MAG: AmmeMemoRadiSam system protein A [Gammaproteobacteria bacterium]